MKRPPFVIEPTPRYRYRDENVLIRGIFYGLCITVVALLGIYLIVVLV